MNPGTRTPGHRSHGPLSQGIFLFFYFFRQEFIFFQKFFFFLSVFSLSLSLFLSFSVHTLRSSRFELQQSTLELRLPVPLHSYQGTSMTSSMSHGNRLRSVSSKL